MKIIEYLIDDLDILKVDEVAFVSKPAIQKNFEAFAEVSFNDYPDSVVEAAKRGIDLNESINNKCATQVGKVRAQQLANKEKVSIDTIQRMRAFLIRQKGNYDLAVERRDYTACGYISYLLWGGPDALPWAERKLKEIDIEFSLEDACWPGYEAIGTKMKDGREVPNCVRKSNFSDEDMLEILLEYFVKDEFSLDVSTLPDYVNEIKTKLQSGLNKKRMVIGPLMTPNKLIPRKDKKTGEIYQVFFTEDTIRKIAHKFMKTKLIDSVNIEHNPNQKVEDVYLVETWICEDPEHDKSTLYGCEPIVGEWYGIYKIDNDEVWNDYIETGLVNGFSVEGYFAENLISE